MVYKHMKKGSILLVVGKLPIKTTIRCQYTPNRLSSILKCDGTVKGAHLQETAWHYLMTLRICTLYDTEVQIHVCLSHYSGQAGCSLIHASAGISLNSSVGVYILNLSNLTIESPFFNIHMLITSTNFATEKTF